MCLPKQLAVTVERKRNQRALRVSEEFHSCVQTPGCNRESSGFWVAGLAQHSHNVTSRCCLTKLSASQHVCVWLGLVQLLHLSQFQNMVLECLLRAKNNPTNVGASNQFNLEDL